MEMQLPKIGQGIGLYKWDDTHVSILREGIDLGLTMIDTAESYSHGQTEEMLSKVIKDIRNKVIISSKFSPEHSRFNEVIKSAEGSLKRLKTDYIDIYYQHWPSYNVEVEETMQAMSKLKNNGKIRYIGLSNPSVLNIDKARKIDTVDFVQVEYNLFNRCSDRDIVPYCKNHNIQIVAYSPLDQGKVTDTSGNTLLNPLLQKYKKTKFQIALNWIVSKNIIPIPKASNVLHLRENAASLSFKMSDEDIKYIDNNLSSCIEMIDTKNIEVLSKSTDNRPICTTLQDAISNTANYSPSPNEISQHLSSNILPVKLIKEEDKYFLIEGRSRFWAWIIKYGYDYPIPALIRR